MNIGLYLRTLYIEPIDDPPPTEDPIAVEQVPGPLPDPAVRLQLVR
jgi:hypothetical protein